MPDARTLLLLDVDTGIDDALGLLYACAAPEAQILGVSTVAGNVDLARATRNTRAVLALAGRADIPGLAGLRSSADARGARTRSAVHGGSGLGHAVLPEPAAASNSRRTLSTRSSPPPRPTPANSSLVATGPLTNIAVALMREPELPTTAEAPRADGRRVQGRRQRHAGRRIQHLARSRGGAHRVRPLRRRRRRAACRGRPRRHAPDATAARASGRTRAALRRRAARPCPARLPRGFDAPLFRIHRSSARGAAISSCTTRSPSPRRSIRR